MTAMRIAAAAALVLALRNGPARAEASDAHHAARASATHAVPARTAVSPKAARATRAPKAPLRRTPARDRSTDLELPQLG